MYITSMASEDCVTNFSWDLKRNRPFRTEMRVREINMKRNQVEIEFGLRSGLKYLKIKSSGGFLSEVKKSAFQ